MELRAWAPSNLGAMLPYYIKSKKPPSTGPIFFLRIFQFSGGNRCRTAVYRQEKCGDIPLLQGVSRSTKNQERRVSGGLRWGLAATNGDCAVHVSFCASPAAVEPAEEPKAAGPSDRLDAEERPHGAALPPTGLDPLGSPVPGDLPGSPAIGEPRRRPARGNGGCLDRLRLREHEQRSDKLAGAEQRTSNIKGPTPTAPQLPQHVGLIRGPPDSPS